MFNHLFIESGTLDDEFMSWYVHDQQVALNVKESTVFRDYLVILKPSELLDTHE